MYGAFIRAARKRAGKTIGEAASAAGISVDGLSRVERDVNGATMNTLEKLASVYGCMVGDLLPHSGSGRSPDVEGLLAAISGLEPGVRKDLVAGLTSHASHMASLLSRPPAQQPPAPAKAASSYPAEGDSGSIGGSKVG